MGNAEADSPDGIDGAPFDMEGDRQVADRDEVAHEGPPARDAAIGMPASSGSGESIGMPSAAKFATVHAFSGTRLRIAVRAPQRATVSKSSRVESTAIRRRPAPR